MLCRVQNLSTGFLAATTVFEVSKFGFADQGMALCKLIASLKYKLYIVGGQDRGLRDASLETWLNWETRPIDDIEKFVNVGFLGDLIGVYTD